MAINDTVLLTVKGTVLGQDHVHTLHFRYQDVAASEQGLIDAWQAGPRDEYRAMFDNTDTCIDLYTARQVCGSLPLRAPVEEVEVAPNRVGAADFVSDPAPTWLAMVASERTASAGRSRRGRFYIGGLYESEIAGNNVGATHLARLQAYIDALALAFITAGGALAYRLVIHSHKLASVPGTQCQDSSTPVTGIIARSVLGTQKSRKPGSGN